MAFGIPFLSIGALFFVGNDLSLFWHGLGISVEQEKFGACPQLFGMGWRPPLLGVLASFIPAALGGGLCVGLTRRLITTLNFIPHATSNAYSWAPI